MVWRVASTSWPRLLVNHHWPSCWHQYNGRPRSASQDCIHGTELDLSSRPTSSIRLSHFHFGNSCRALDHVIGDTLRSTPVCHSRTLLSFPRRRESSPDETLLLFCLLNR